MVRHFWVELLSPAKLLCLCHPVNVVSMFILLVWSIGFGVTGMELVNVMPTVQGFCPVRC
jgi:hypothetical protein